MSVKDVKEYANVIYKDFHESIVLLKEAEEMYNENVISEERFNAIKDSVEPIRTNYARISYILYLLDRPNRKEKINKYNKQRQDLLNTFNNSNEKAIHEENVNALNNLSSLVK